MRYIKDIPHPEFKIGVYHWNNKYIVKIELGMFEQTYKIEDYEVQNIEELEPCFDSVFLESVKSKFDGMQADFFETLHRNQIIF